MRDWFSKFARKTSDIAGSYWAFLAAITLIFVWLVTGPIFHFSDTWQLVINTGTTVITFLMVFLIQHTQNRDAKAMHLKLDEIIRAMEPARNSIIELEEFTDEELDRLEKQFLQFREMNPEVDKQVESELKEVAQDLENASKDMREAAEVTVKKQEQKKQRAKSQQRHKPA